jgi:hypothetical protein
MNANYAFPLAISGTKLELKAIAEELLKLRYEWNEEYNKHSVNLPELVTNFNLCCGIIGYTIHANLDRHPVSVAQHGTPCILALASARTGDGWVKGEPLLNINLSAISPVLNYSKMPVDYDPNTRRPTFDEIVNWYAHGSIYPKVEQPEQAQPETLYDLIKAGKVDTVYSEWYGKGKAELSNTTERKEYPIWVKFDDGKQCSFSENGQHNINSKVINSKYDIAAYVKPVAEPRKLTSALLADLDSEANTQPKTPTSNEIRVMAKVAIEAINEAVKCMNDYESLINYQEGKIDELQAAIDRLEAANISACDKMLSQQSRIDLMLSTIDRQFATITIIESANEQIRNHDTLLTTRNSELLIDNSRLTNANSALTQEIEQLNRLAHGNSNAALVAENTTLKDEVARLNHWINTVKSFS